MELTEKLEDTAMSYIEWQDAGFAVKKGQKSRIRDVLGCPQFTLVQVRPITEEAWDIFPGLVADL